MVLNIKKPSQTKHTDKEKALADVVKTKTYRLSVDLDEVTYLALKKQALDEGRKGVDLVRDAIKRYLA